MEVFNDCESWNWNLYSENGKSKPRHIFITQLKQLLFISTHFLQICAWVGSMHEFFAAKLKKDILFVCPSNIFSPGASSFLSWYFECIEKGERKGKRKAAKIFRKKGVDTLFSRFYFSRPHHPTYPTYSSAQRAVYKQCAILCRKKNTDCVLRFFRFVHQNQSWEIIFFRVSVQPL